MNGEEKPNTNPADGALAPPPGAHGTMDDGQGGDEPIPDDLQNTPEDQD